MTSATLQPPAELAQQQEMLNFAEQATALHQDIFALQDGVPSAENFWQTQQLAQNMSFDAVSGKYFGPNDVELDPEVAEDLMHVIKPETWIQSGSMHDAIDHALKMQAKAEKAGTIASEDPLVADFAERLGVNPHKVDALRRALNLDKTVHNMLAEQGVDPAKIREYELASEADLLGMTPIETHRGVLTAEEPKKLEITRPEQLDEEDGTIVARLIEAGARTEHEIAAALYPEKMASGKATYNKAWTRGRLDYGLDKLNEAERAEVASFVDIIDFVGVLERATIEKFKQGEGLPATQDVAQLLFPHTDTLTPSQQEAVSAVMHRLAAVRLQQVLPDRFAWLRMRKEAATELKDKLHAGVSAFLEKHAPTPTRVGKLVGAAALSLTLAFGTLQGGILQRAADMAHRERAVVAAAGMTPGEPTLFQFSEQAVVNGRPPERLLASQTSLGSTVVREVLKTKASVSDALLGVGVRLEFLKTETMQRLAGFARNHLKHLGETNAKNANQLNMLLSGLVFLGAGALALYRFKMGLGGTSANSDLATALAGASAGTETDAIPMTDSAGNFDIKAHTPAEVPDTGKVMVLGKWDDDVTNRWGAHKGSVSYVTGEYIESLDLGAEYEELGRDGRNKVVQQIMDYNNFTMPSDRMPSNLEIKMPPRALLIKMISNASDDDDDE